MYVNYSKIITDNFKLFVTEEQLESLKQVAEKEKTYLKNRYHKDTIKELLSKKANEVVYVNTRHQLRNDIEKAIIASNIVFENNNKFASILLKGNFDKDTLETYTRLLSYLKSKIATDTIEESDKRYLEIADNFTKKLVIHFTKFIGKIDHNIIINKINEIVSFYPELLETKQVKHSR